MISSDHGEPNRQHRAASPNVPPHNPAFDGILREIAQASQRGPRLGPLVCRERALEVTAVLASVGREGQQTFDWMADHRITARELEELRTYLQRREDELLISIV